MEFVDSETQRLLRTTARSYLANAYPWERLYRIESGDERLAADSLRPLADLGWFGLLAPQTEGDGSLLDAAVVIDELGYAGVPAPVAAANVAAYLLRDSNAAGELLADLATGRRLCTVSEATRRQGTAQPLVASGGSVSGALPLVPFADVCAFVLAPLLLEGEPAFAALPLAAACHPRRGAAVLAARRWV